MIHLLKKTFLFFILISTIFSVSSTYAESTQKSQYIKLNPSSSTYDVKKFQKFFKALKIYSGNIDGKYDNIQPYIINFQVKNNIIPHAEVDGAGYIGPKTYQFFEKKYGKKFTTVYNTYFQIKEPEIGNQKYFIVSAYYSPLPGQKKYSTGTYAGDIRLNGSGTHGASGKAVHPGFIAAPSKYSFGTKIQIEGLGVGTVEDRGGAIVRAGVRGYEHDRLDIWMGYGDAGLQKALNWGKRTVKGKILPASALNTIEYAGSKDDVQESLAIKISPESKESELEKMQKLFTQAGLYSGRTDGKYQSLKPSILSFQIKNNIISNNDSYGAGYIGNKTITKLEEKYPKIFLAVRKKTQLDTVSIANNNSIKKDSRFTVSTSTNVSKKYNISNTQKKQIETLYKKLETLLKKKYGNNKMKLKTEKNKLSKKVLAISNKAKQKILKEKLKYLYDLLKA